MFLLARLSRSSPIRSSSRTRQYFLDLKKLYRSTTSTPFMASDLRSPSPRTCFVFDKDQSTKLLIQMVYDIPSTKSRRKFNMLRSVDDSLAQTIRRLTANIEQATKKENRSLKRRAKAKTNLPLEAEQPALLIQLLDEQQQPVDEKQTNQQAWLHGRQLLINEQMYNIVYNAPGEIDRLRDLSMLIEWFSDRQIPFSRGDHDQHSEHGTGGDRLRRLGTFSLRLVRGRGTEDRRE